MLHGRAASWVRLASQQHPTDCSNEATKHGPTGCGLQRGGRDCRVRCVLDHMKNQGMRQGSNSRRGRSGRPNTNKRSFSQGGPNRNLESNGPNVKLRGTAVQVYDKYLTLARDATSSGDRVAAENFFQHAEHYFRIMNGLDDIAVRLVI